MSATSLLRAVSGQFGLHTAFGAWARAISGAADGLKQDVTFPTIRIPTGANAPTQIEVGPTIGWTFAVPGPNYAYCEVPLHPALDRAVDLVVGVGWAPAGSEVAKTVTWRVDVGFEELGSIVTDIDETIDTTVAVPAVAADYARSPLLITPAMLALRPQADELHLRFTRVASAADPVADPGLHHVVVIQTLQWP